MIKSDDYYGYKRYRLTLNEDNPEHRKIIEYLDSFAGGRSRNGALLNLILAGMGKQVDTAISTTSQMLDKRALQGLKDIDRKIDKVLQYVTNFMSDDMDNNNEVDNSDTDISTAGEEDIHPEFAQGQSSKQDDDIDMDIDMGLKLPDGIASFLDSL